MVSQIVNYSGFGRLFAGDTCIGHTTHNEENLHTLISTDLEYLNAWSYRGHTSL
jgi:hypothetical protein